MINGLSHHLVILLLLSVKRRSKRQGFPGSELIK
jgi:hypothetical protein